MLKNMLLRRCISRSRPLAIISRSPSHYESPGSFRSLNSACAGRDSPTISHKPPPWPMLPPVVGGGGAEIVGCSHGWVAVFNKRSNDLFLTDPLSHRKINLPAIHTLPDRDFYLDVDGCGIVNKVILSSDAGGGECRAVMAFGAGNRHAFCVPGRSSEWTPLGEALFESDHHFPFLSVAKVHEDVVYCTRRKLFTSITACHIDFASFCDLTGVDARPNPEIYDWDIKDPNSPLIVGSDRLIGFAAPNRWLMGFAAPNRWLAENIEILRDECVEIPHLVYAEESDQLFVVVQFVRLMNPDSDSDSDSPLGYVPRCEVKGVAGVFPGKTFGFAVMEMLDGEKRDLYEERVCTAVEDLNGMSMFVGINHSFAVSISERDQLFKPNCIYFTDAKRLRMVSCAGDAGVFDYATKTISPLNHRILPTQASPFWFT